MVTTAPPGCGRRRVSRATERMAIAYPFVGLAQSTASCPRTRRLLAAKARTQMQRRPSRGTVVAAPHGLAVDGDLCREGAGQQAPRNRKSMRIRAANRSLRIDPVHHGVVGGFSAPREPPHRTGRSRGTRQHGRFLPIRLPRSCRTAIGRNAQRIRSAPPSLRSARSGIHREPNRAIPAAVRIPGCGVH